MKINNIKYLIVGLGIFLFSNCDSMPEPEIEHSPIWPLAGEWLTHVYNEDGTVAEGTVTEDTPWGTLFALRTYNTSDNVSDKAWIRLGTTQGAAVWGKVDCNPSEKIFSGSNIANELKTGQTFTIIEGKVMLNATTLQHHGASGVTTDSIYIRYTSSSNNRTYIVKGHRTTHFLEDNY